MTFTAKMQTRLRAKKEANVTEASRIDDDTEETPDKIMSNNSCFLINSPGRWQNRAT